MRYLSAELKQIVAAGDAERCHAEDGKTDGRHVETQRGRPYPAARQLPEVHREDQVPGSEKHAKQSAGDKDGLLEAQSCFHGLSSINRSFL